MKRPHGLPALLLNLMLSLGLHAALHAAEPLKLATGEYAPFTGEDMPGGGPLTEIVRRAFAATDPDIKISFLPWKRGYSETLEGKYDGTFPYGRTTEREKDFYFSESYYTVDRRMYYLAESGLKPEDITTVKGKRYCLPLGFMLTKDMGAMVENKTLEVLSPPDLASCTKMLLIKRVDFFVTTPNIAKTAMAQAGIQENAFVSKSLGKSENFLIVPKSHPRGPAIIATFNKGIAALRAKGELDKIIKDAKL